MFPWVEVQSVGNGPPACSLQLPLSAALAAANRNDEERVVPRSKSPSGCQGAVLPSLALTRNEEFG
jgi:hypothetical protein